MRSESRTPAARWAASNTDVQSGRGPPGSGASIGSRICPAACEERASARVRSWPREKGRRISGSYAETATRSARTSLEASSISLLLPTPGSPSTITAVGRRSAGARATAARTTSSSCVRPKNLATPATLRVPRSRLDPREVPHDTSRRHPYRPSHRCGPGNGPAKTAGRWSDAWLPLRRPIARPDRFHRGRRRGAFSTYQGTYRRCSSRPHRQSGSRDDGRRRLVAVDGDVWTELGIVVVCVRQVNANSSSATSGGRDSLERRFGAASIAVTRLLREGDPNFGA